MQNNNLVLQPNIRSKMLFNTVVQIAAKVIIGLIGIITTVYIARNLKADNFGIYIFVLVFINLFKFLMMLVTDQIAVQDISIETKYKASFFMGNILIIKSFLSLITILAAVLTINLLGYPAVSRKLVYIGCLFFISSILSSSIIVLQANLKMIYDGIASILGAIVYLLWIIISFQLGKGLVTIMWGWVVCDMLRWLIVFLASYNILKPKFTIDVKFCQDIFKKSFPIWLASICIALFFYVDTLMLSKIKGDYAVGIYGVAYKIIIFLMIFPQAISISAFPRLSRLYVFDKSQFRAFYYRLCDYTLIIALPLTIVTYLFSKNIILVLFRSNFLESVTALRILVFAIPPIFLGMIISHALLAINQRIKSLFCAFCAAIINIGLNIIIIPRYSFKGAALVSVLTHTLLLFMMLYYLYRYEKLSFKTLPAIILVNIIFGISAVIIKPLRIYYSIPLLMFIYLTLVHFTKCINFKELLSLRRIDTKKKEYNNNNNKSYFVEI